MKMEEVDGPGLATVLAEETRAVLVDCWSPWCAPCRALKPHLAKLAEERTEDWRFVALNTEAHPDAAEEHGVQALPTLLLYRNGEEVRRLAGGVTLGAVVESLDEIRG